MVENHVADQLRRHVEQARDYILHAIHHRDGIGVAALLQDRKIDGPLAVHAHHVGLDLLRVLGDPDVGHAHRRRLHRPNREVVDLRDAAKLAVGVDAVVQRTDLDVARRQNQVGIVHRPHHVHQAHPMRFQLVWIGVHHDLPVPPSEGLRNGCAGHARNLVADIELGQIAQSRLIQAFAFKRHQADRQAGRVKLQNHGRQRSRRQPPQLRHRQVGDGGDGGIGIGPGLEIHLDDADARQRARLDMLNAAAQREEALEAAGDVGFDLFRRHSGIERGHHHHGDVHRRKHIHGHASQAADADHRDHQADHDDQIRGSDGKT